MKTVKYGVEAFQTSDAVANALMTFAASLRSMDHGLLVTVPTIEEDGREGSISLVLGPGIPILSRPSVSAVADPDAVALLEQMSQATRKRTTASAVVPGETGPDIAVHLNLADAEHLERNEI
ncbi:hypothetical protein N1028_15680 [Herbiconiux sp. CPCC 203407]|uniref:Uncharacterized protein n=1 Tax=Herbiconiux oxytropis TaxID=2970915 RepID=A0AA41XFP3_9MICO|nr:hypothetical protein [Herbiconiux oxytropis]MCS5721810.1 hypothetical protein [Herbiconiux oxytropis]MCS5727336.1 hypothetical protein [Herbiconiux oxytropis]